MRSNISDIAVVDAMDCGSGGVISAAVGLGGDSQISMVAAWIRHRGGQPMRERRPCTMR
jgi:hypothetical protein